MAVRIRTTNIQTKQTKQTKSTERELRGAVPEHTAIATIHKIWMTMDDWTIFKWSKYRPENKSHLNLILPTFILLKFILLPNWSIVSIKHLM